MTGADTRYLWAHRDREPLKFLGVEYLEWRARQNFSSSIQITPNKVHKSVYNMFWLDGFITCTVQLPWLHPCSVSVMLFTLYSLAHIMGNHHHYLLPWHSHTSYLVTMRVVTTLSLLFGLVWSQEDTRVVNTHSGPVRGKKVTKGDHHHFEFLGIPYAEPPLGKLRFKPPEPVKPWTDVYEAFSDGPVCYQVRSEKIL